MIKRGVIQLGGAEPKIRISKPGVDVDSAGETDFLLHENHLYSQPYHFSFVECPFAGDTTSNKRFATTSVTVPDVSDTPIVLIWPVNSDDAISNPMARDTGTGNSQSGFSVNRSYAFVEVVSSTQVDVSFLKPSGTRKALNGAYIVLMRGEN